MKTRHFIFFLLLSIFFAACNKQTPSLSANQKAEVEKQIREISMKWMVLWKNQDLEGLKTLFTDDAVVFRPNKEPVVGPAAIIDVFAKEFEQNPKSLTDWNTDHVEISVSGDIAIEYGSFSVAGLGPDGTGDDRGKFVTVYRNVNGNWKVYSDIGSSTKPSEPEKQVQ